MTVPDFIQHGLILCVINCRAVAFRQGDGQPVDFVLDSFQASEDALDTFFHFHIPAILMFMNNLNGKGRTTIRNLSFFVSFSCVCARVLPEITALRERCRLSG